jgi:hypothetical protein
VTDGRPSPRPDPGEAKALLVALRPTWPGGEQYPPRVIGDALNRHPELQEVCVIFSELYRLEVAHDCFRKEGLLRIITELARREYDKQLLEHPELILRCRPEWSLEPRVRAKP